MTHINILSLLVIILFCLGCQSVAVKHVEVKEVITASVSEKTRPIKLSKVIVKMKRGEEWGSIQSGLLCIPGSTKLKWRTGRINITSELLSDMFRESFENAGYSVAGNPDDLFENSTDVQTDYFIGGLIKDIKANVCYPLAGFGNWEDVQGEAYIDIEWQVFDTLNRKVVKTVKTEGSYKRDETEDGFTAEMIIEEAFSVAVNNLLANREIADMLTSSPIQNIVSDPHTSATYIKFNDNELNSFQENVTEIRASVATVRTSSGHGSGFFISRDGYMLTNQHVVGEADFVKVILPTGREMIGNVIKTDSSRDIALIKTEQVGIKTLFLDVSSPQISSEVYAVGSPLEEKYESTVSKGVVSGFREDRGQNYIQSDVNVLPGNSGGPLLNDDGNVIGLTVSARLFRNVPSGINFFIPIESALNSLNIKKK